MTPTGKLALAGIAALIVLVLFWRRRRQRTWRRENWEFAEGGEKKIKKEHKQFIRDKCAAGLTWTYITNNPKWDFLAKYDGDVAWKICEGQLSKVGTGDADASGCAHGPCPVDEMKGRRPCLNMYKTKCCNKQYKDCYSRWGRWDPRPAAARGGVAATAAPAPAADITTAAAAPAAQAEPTFVKYEDRGPDLILYKFEDMKTDVARDQFKIETSKMQGNNWQGELLGWDDIGEKGYNDWTEAVYLPKGITVRLHEGGAGQGEFYDLRTPGLHSLKKAKLALRKNVSAITVYKQ